MPEPVPTTSRATAGSVTARARSLAGWLLAPATEEVPRHQAVGATALRVVLGLLWLWNAGWKSPPDFGENGERGLFKFTSFAVSDPVLPPYSWVVEHLVLPNLAVFGWGVLLAESALAILLLSGAWVRAAAALGTGQSLVIGLSVAFAPEEWPWSYWLMVVAHVALMLSSAGRLLAVDAVRANLADARVLTRVAGVVAVAVGLVAAATSVGEPLAARGTLVGFAPAEVGFGTANLIGGLLLVLVGALLVVDTTLGAAGLWAAAALAAVGALSLHAQIGFSDPLLGGSASSAALLLTLALVAATRARVLTRSGGSR